MGSCCPGLGLRLQLCAAFGDVDFILGVERNKHHCVHFSLSDAVYIFGKLSVEFSGKEQKLIFINL